uniref:Bifunctional ligase/repressor BirA n=2 Tax=Alcanivoracaceae TaxID=224372 RepID=Q0VSN2_ALCBS|nr:biotin-[acetyl-CoA-carboxylase] ligase [Alcanivorax borkumensis SK2]
MGSVSEMKEADLALVRLLSDGSFRSGSELGDELGISRAGVWKRVRRLTDFGLALESVKGKGYRLAQPLELIDPDIVRRHLHGAADLHYQWVTGSTNADALALSGPVVRPQVFITECQQAGRGRRGRAWQSPFAANLYASIRFTLNGGFAALGGLSLAVGVVVGEALRAFDPALPVALKWPNDLLVNGAKVGGILIELAGEMEGRVDVVIGVGLNGRMTAAQAELIDQRWTDLATVLTVMPSRTELASQVITQLMDMLPLFQAQGFDAFKGAFADFDAVSGKKVVVSATGQNLVGVAVGVASDGALLLETDDGIRSLYGGEVSLRIQ